MELDKLKEYVAAVADMEKDCYMKKELIGQYEDELKKVRSLANYKKKHIEPPEDTSSRLAESEEDEFLIGKAVLILFVTFVAILSLKEKFVWGIVIIAVAGLVFKYLKPDSKESEAVIAARNKYEEEMHNYMAAVQEEDKRVQDAMVKRGLRLEYFDKLLAKTKENLEATEARLQQLYDLNIIFPKYRNLAMVCSLHEYLISGRCESLEGQGGAYNILEQEIRLDRIIVGLDNIGMQLEQIKQNQYELYEAVRDVNLQLDRLYDSSERLLAGVGEIAGNTAQLSEQVDRLYLSSAMNTYFTARAQQELSYLNKNWQ